MENIYQPEKVKITKIEPYSADVKLFRFEKEAGEFAKNKEGLAFTPGQFVLAGLFGYGEAPFGLASSPEISQYLEIVVRKTGNLTEALHRLKESDDVFLRGPYGNGFPLDFIRGKDVVMISGGCGIPPIASLTEYIVANRDKFNNVYLIYGAKTPQGILMKDKMKEWGNKIKVLLTVDQPGHDWQGYKGMVSELIDDVAIEPKNAVAAMCGPGPMMEALEKVLRPLGISDRRIFVSMERKMQCGIGKCQHCVTGDKYVCQDGPVFYFDQIDKNWD